MSYISRIALSSCLFFAQLASAKGLFLQEIGVSVEVPDNWKAVIQSNGERTMALLKPEVDNDANSVLRCAINRHSLPERFRKITQERINALIEAQPLTSEKFAAQLAQYGGVPVSISESGLTTLGNSRANWALATANETVNGTTAHYKTKYYLAQTPGYAWNVQCASASTLSASASAQRYKSGEAIFERLFFDI